ncbi:glutamate--cysteine ligase [Streptomyces sp. RerS4]|uniref:carboxylate-amine ligase n=1 Tax=Streptomyces sp. RerS4 TaxID=2942449 RepID=UPI00201CA344|nr:glutamate--cysteine ligase [Streptomyces sp. RerS4]UQX04245.1 glutamate--cysteine ligase [Streptomyces sp. RerS4]
MSLTTQPSARIAPDAARTAAGCLPGPTFGVEEEFLLVDRRTRAPAGRASQVIAALAPVLGPQVQREFYTTQVEVCTRPVHDAEGLRADLARMRALLVPAAREAGCLLVGTGTPVIPPEFPMAITGDDRYRVMAERFAGAIGARDQVVCGCHVHVGVDSKAQALALSTRMRPWLPVFQALAANSPFDRGRDSGWASWRAIEHARWPTVGPAPVLNEPGYDLVANALIRRTGLLDRKMIYWYARPSEHVPTLEIRVADSNADLDVVVLIATLVRGLVAALLPQLDTPAPALAAGPGAVREAHRLAALGGLDGEGLDLLHGRRLPAWQLVERLVEQAAPGLEAVGELDAVGALVDRLRLTGGGAARQRASYRRRGRLSDVVDDLARTTAAAVI